MLPSNVAWSRSYSVSKSDVETTFLQLDVLQRVSLHALEQVREPLILERRRSAVAEHGLALGRELAELASSHYRRPRAAER